mgnify:CR=1 FL=1
MLPEWSRLSDALKHVEAFNENIGLKQLINDIISYRKAPNSTFEAADILDYMIDAAILGYSRFMHMDDLGFNPVYQNIKGQKLPSEKVCRGLLKALPEETLQQLRTLNQKILSLKANNEQPGEVTLDFDDTVCTVYGSQEGTACGYNPRYHGRTSFKEKLGIIANTHEFIDLTLEKNSSCQS